MLEKECDEVLRVMYEHHTKGNVPDIQKILKPENIIIPDKDLAEVLTILYRYGLVEGAAQVDNRNNIRENTAIMSVTLIGIAFSRTESFVEKKRIRDLEDKLKEQQVTLNDSIMETNRISKTTNIFIAIFTGVAGMYYLKELLDYAIPISKTYNKVETVIVFALSIPVSFVIVYTALRISLKRYRKLRKKSIKLGAKT